MKNRTARNKFKLAGISEQMKNAVWNVRGIKDGT
jgi:hypothetical protein